MSVSMREQFADTMRRVGIEDPNLVVLVGDISHFILQPFAESCPGRYYNVGICEPTILGMAAGLSRTGFHPVVHTIAPFLIERGFEQIKLDFCYQKLSGTLITVGSAFDYANLGSTHHCYGDFALLKTLPGTEIFYPASPAEFDVLFRRTYANRRLSVFRIPGTPHGQPIAPESIRVGRAVLFREGTDLTVVATGPHLRTAVDAVEGLAAAGWDPEIVYLHTIRPLDTERIVASVEKTGRVVVVEEHMRSGGVGDDILRCLSNRCPFRYASLSIPDRFVTDYGTYADHCRALGLTPEGLIETVRKTF